MGVVGLWSAVILGEPLLGLLGREGARRFVSSQVSSYRHIVRLMLPSDTATDLSVEKAFPVP